MPFCDEACGGDFPSYRKRVVVQKDFAVACVKCKVPFQVQGKSLRYGGECECPSCGHKSCARCGRESCCCEDFDERQSKYAFSRYFVGTNRERIRVKDINAESLRLQKWDADCDECPSVSCPKCQASIARTGACHEMSHCGSKICWVSARSTLPWEPCLPSWHWEEVPRWEHECNVQTFVCQEGVCYTQAEECRCAEHEEGRQDMNDYRMEMRRHLMMKEVKKSDFVQRN